MMTKNITVNTMLISHEEMGFVWKAAVAITIVLLSSPAVAQPVTGEGKANPPPLAGEKSAAPDNTAEGVSPADADAPSKSGLLDVKAEGVSPADADAPSKNEQLDAKSEIEALKLRMEKLEQTSAAAVEENMALKEHVEMLDEAQVDQMEEDRLALKLYGFLDVQWYKFMYPDDSTFNHKLNNKNSFAVGHWNLYVERQLSDAFRVLGEVRFLFQPYGEETSITSSISGMESTFARANTKATDWVDAYYFDWGGIAIQRAWIEYKLNDYFNVRAGRYLTPYGIWNVDHASTVVIPAHRPFLSTAELMPESQTGIQVFGRAFPNSKTSIDYGLTLSNGRGPTTKLYDLDENKAMGLNLGFAYDGPVSLSFGTYLFIGEYTDITRSLVLNYATSLFEYGEDKTVNYVEKSMAFHLKIEAFGLLIQGEYARGLIRYKNGGRPMYFTDFYTGKNVYYPDYIQEGAYALAAYRLPFDAFNISPYFIFEYQKPSMQSGVPIGNNYGGGINWRILPSVVWKVEVVNHQEGKELFGFYHIDYTIVSTQLAVAY